MTTEERLEALERGLSTAKRRNKYLLIGLVVLAVGWAFTSTTGTVRAQSDENTIRAERFELVDYVGNVCAVLGVTDSMPGLLLNDANGTIRARLDVSDEFGTGLNLYDENGAWRAGLNVSDEFGTGLNLYDENGAWRAVLTVGDEGETGLRLYDENGTIRAMLIVTDKGPMLSLFHENGRVIWSAP